MYQTDPKCLKIWNIKLHKIWQLKNPILYMWVKFVFSIIRSIFSSSKVTLDVHSNFFSLLSRFSFLSRSLSMSVLFVVYLNGECSEQKEKKKKEFGYFFILFIFCLPTGIPTLTSLFNISTIPRMHKIQLLNSLDFT